jgi:signal transduction histidine kinase
MRMAHMRMYKQKRVLEETVHQGTLELARTTTDLRACQHLLVQAQRLTAIGTMVSGIAHDFNNALMLIMGSGEILLDDAEHRTLTKENAVPLLKDILAASRDASTLVRRLRQFTRSGEPVEKHLPLNLNLVVEQAVSFTKPKWDSHAVAEGSGIRLEVDYQDLPVILGDAARLRDAITNLIFNALDAMPTGGALTLRTRALGHCARLEVSDTGIGMTEEVRRNCLEPFFTTKGEHGTGLGLAMVFGIVQNHSGTIEIASTPGKGTTFTMIFPASE